MADRQPHQIQVHSRRDQLGQHDQQGRGPSGSKILAVMTVLPVGGTLLALSGLTLSGTLFGLGVSTPLFMIFSPILFPAAILLGLAVSAILTSGMLGLSALSSLSWVVNSLRQAAGMMPEQMDIAKRRMQDMAGYVGQKTKEVGQEIQSKAQDQGRRT